MTAPRHSPDAAAPCGLSRSGLHDVGRERNPERFGDLLVEDQLLDRNFLERDVARLLAAQDTREDFRRRSAAFIPADADRDQRARGTNSGSLMMRGSFASRAARTIASKP